MEMYQEKYVLEVGVPYSIHDIDMRLFLQVYK